MKSLPGTIAVWGVLHCAALFAAEPPLKEIRIVLTGDSTVADNAGWGPAFAELLTPEAKCFNHAKGGASTKSFYTGNYWKNALAQKPDYVLIQFGHNDQPGKGPQRETDPQTTYRENLVRFITETKAAGGGRFSSPRSFAASFSPMESCRVNSPRTPPRLGPLPRSRTCRWSTSSQGAWTFTNGLAQKRPNRLVPYIRSWPESSTAHIYRRWALGRSPASLPTNSGKRFRNLRPTSASTTPRRRSPLDRSRSD